MKVRVYAPAAQNPNSAPEGGPNGKEKTIRALFAGVPELKV